MLDLARFRLLVALSAKLTLRGYLNSKPALLGAVLMLLIGVPTTLRIALHLQHFPLSTTLLVIFAALIATPLVLTSLLPGSGDPARLLHYPITPRTLAAALAVGAFLEPVGLLIQAPILLALPAHFGLSLLVPLALLILCGLLLGQVALFLGGALARSRRVREGLSLLVPFVAAGVLLLVVRAPAKAATPVLLPRPPALALSLTPPGLAAQHDLLGSLGLVVWVGAAFLLAGRLAAARAGVETERNNGARVGLSPLRYLRRGPALSMAGKELSYFLREPRLRGVLSRSSAVMVVVGVITLHPVNVSHVLWDSVLGTGIVLYLVLWLLERACNQWGTEAAAGRLLWSFPGARWRWVLGKNLALFPLLSLCVGFTLTEYALIAHPPTRALAGFFLTGGLWILGVLGIGNVVSLFIPFPALGKAAQTNPGQDFTTGLLYLVIGLVAAYLTAEPWLAPLLWILSVPLAGYLLARREPQVIEALE